MHTITFTRTSETSLDRSESISVATFVALNSEKCQQIVSGLIEKSFASKVRKLDLHSQVTVDLDSLLNDLLISSSGRITRETFLEYFRNRKIEIAELFCSSRNISAEKFASFSPDQLTKLFAAVESLIERCAISLSGRSNSTAQFSATLAELQMLSALPDLPESFAPKFAEAISAQEFDF